MNGNHGKILHVDLSTGNLKQVGFAEEFARAFRGGNGFAAKLIYDHVPPEVHPFAEENAVVFAVGPLTDTPMWGTSRGHMAFISPQTGLFADSNFGGDFAAIQKRTGNPFLVAQNLDRGTNTVFLEITQIAARTRILSSHEYKFGWISN